MTTKSAAETVFKLREKLFSEPATLVTIASALATIYGYVYGYHYELGVMAAYKIPSSFAHVDVPLIIQSAFQAVGGVALLMTGAVAFIKRIERIRYAHRRYLVGTTAWLLFLFISIKYLFERQSLWSAVASPVFLFVFCAIFIYCLYWEIIIAYNSFANRKNNQPSLRQENPAIDSLINFNSASFCEVVILASNTSIKVS